MLDMQGGGEDVCVDMPNFRPEFDGKPARFCYFSGSVRPEGWFPFNKLVKADLLARAAENWDAGEHCLVSEPFFVPSPEGDGSSSNEDLGLVLSIVHDAKSARCELAVFDAAKFGEGPHAMVDMGKLSPWNVHGCWEPA